jgi:hypothetical protein
VKIVDIAFFAMPYDHNGDPSTELNRNLYGPDQKQSSGFFGGFVTIVNSAIHWAFVTGSGPKHSVDWNK